MRRKVESFGGKPASLKGKAPKKNVAYGIF